MDKGHHYIIFAFQVEDDLDLYKLSSRVCRSGYAVVIHKSFDSVVNTMDCNHEQEPDKGISNLIFILNLIALPFLVELLYYVIGVYNAGYRNFLEVEK